MTLMLFRSVQVSEFIYGKPVSSSSITPCVHSDTLATSGRSPVEWPVDFVPIIVAGCSFSVNIYMEIRENAVDDFSPS